MLIKYNSYNTRSLYAAARTYNYVVRLCDALRRCIHEHAHLWLMQIQNRRSLVTHCNIMHYHSKAANGYLIFRWSEKRCYIISGGVRARSLTILKEQSSRCIHCKFTRQNKHYLFFLNIKIINFSNIWGKQLWCLNFLHLSLFPLTNFYHRRNIWYL